MRADRQFSSCPCDESGLGDAPNAPEDRDRLVLAEDHAVLLVDVSPLVLGHCLVVPREHLPRTARLNDEAYAGVQRVVERGRDIVRRTLNSNVMVVEHGASDARTPFECVRHVHLHLVPVRESSTVSRVAHALSQYADSIDTHPSSNQSAVLSALRKRDGYISVTLGSDTWVATPSRGVRHCSRQLIADVAGNGSDTADWAIAPRGARFESSISALREVDHAI